MKKNSIKDNLMPDEKIIVSAKFHPFRYFGWVSIFFGFVGLLFIIATITDIIISDNFPALAFYHGLGFFLFAFFLVLLKRRKRKRDEFFITDKRMIANIFGYSRIKLEVQNNGISSISLKQGAWGRLFGYGTIKIDGTSVRFVKSPFSFLEKLDKKSFHYEKNGNGIDKIVKVGSILNSIANVADIASSISDVADSTDELQDMGNSVSMPEGTDGLSEIQKLELESKISAAENKEKLANFLKNAYGRDVSEYLD